MPKRGRRGLRSSQARADRKENSFPIRNDHPESGIDFRCPLPELDDPFPVACKARLRVELRENWNNCNLAICGIEKSILCSLEANSFEPPPSSGIFSGSCPTPLGFKARFSSGLLTINCTKTANTINLRRTDLERTFRASQDGGTAKFTTKLETFERNC
ncbi:hypothetical protein HUJ05_001566 [Dendroctonus ponderosae]|nr:hypothetical protein HUJ05_001566 [Dendroctonus ponderosae]